jgi:hypothetical protein
LPACSFISDDPLASGLLASVPTFEIGFPGWPEPNLDSAAGLGRQLEKGGLHQPPFLLVVRQMHLRAGRRSGKACKGGMASALFLC